MFVRKFLQWRTSASQSSSILNKYKLYISKTIIHLAQKDTHAEEKKEEKEKEEKKEKKEEKKHETSGSYTHTAMYTHKSDIHRNTDSGLMAIA
jgi:hypothetical protein